MKRDVEHAGRCKRTDSYCEEFIKERTKYIKQWQQLDPKKLDTESMTNINNMFVMEWLKKDLNPWTGENIQKEKEEI